MEWSPIRENRELDERKGNDERYCCSLDDVESVLPSHGSCSPGGPTGPFLKSFQSATSLCIVAGRSVKVFDPAGNEFTKQSIRLAGDTAF